MPIESERSIDSSSLRTCGGASTPQTGSGPACPPRKTTPGAAASIESPPVCSLPDGPGSGFEGLAAVPGLEGDSAAAASALLVIMERVETAVRLLRQRRPSSQWAETLAVAVGLLAAPGPGGDDERAELERILDRAFTPEDEAVDPELGLDEVTVLSSRWTEDRPGILHHRTGNMTVCTLVPMRSVPYRVVAILGLDGDRFPRAPRHEGDDLLGGHERVGDHDRRSEDRQLLLDAFMAAGDAFIVTYSGRDELTNVTYPPAVPIAELLDVVADLAGPEPAKGIVTAHPLQSFSRVNFEPGRLGVPGAWGFDGLYHDGALALERGPSAPGGDRPLRVAVPPEDPLHLDDLADYFAHPGRHFTRRALRITIPGLEERRHDELPVEASPLELWEVTDRMLRGLLRGVPIAELAADERRRDTLPGGGLRDAPLGQATDRATALLDLAIGSGFEPASVALHAGSIDTAFGRLEGSVTADPESGIVPLVTASRLRGRQRMELYLQLMFLSALEPARPWRGLIVGRPKRGAGLQALELVLPDEAATGPGTAARDRLDALLDVRHQGVRTPLPLFAETSYTWAASKPVRRERDARDAWEPGPFRFRPEAEDPYNRLLFPELGSFAALLETKFARLAETVWWPVTSLLRGVK